MFRKVQNHRQTSPVFAHIVFVDQKKSVTPFSKYCGTHTMVDTNLLKGKVGFLETHGKELTSARRCR